MFTHTHRSGRIVAAILLFGLIAAPVKAELITGAEEVNLWRYAPTYFKDLDDDGKVEEYGGFFWNYKYAIDFDRATVTASVRIDFQFTGFNPVLTPTQQAIWIAGAETAIEEKWNNKHTFVYDNVSIDAVVDVKSDGPLGELYQRVDVRPDNGRANMLNWFWDQDEGGQNVSAHEFGHMLGLYDEYWTGALNKFQFVDYTALMGKTGGDPLMPPRYYQLFEDFVVSLQIPEPAVTTMIISGMLTGLALLRRKRKQRS